MASSQPADEGNAAASPPLLTTTEADGTIRISIPPLRVEHQSESSDEGLHLSPAAARRFARRTMRRTSPTPDLVTSLVRPPSPEAFYLAPQIHNRVRAEIRARMQREGGSTAAGANGTAMRRPGPVAIPHPSSLDIPKRYGGDRIFDLYASNYVNSVDSNLICPICHDPMVDPVATPCDHIFCYRCLRRSLTTSPSGMACPIDREALQWSECSSAARLIRTQLNGLMVKCPNFERGCTSQLRREAIEPHATTECRFREYVCPGKNCDKKLSYKPAEEECQHKDVECGLCEAEIVEADRDAHLLSCPKAKTRCDACWQLVTRSQLPIHYDFDCEGVEVACSFQDIGCPTRVTRGQLPAHILSCAFHPDTPSGAIIRSQRDVISHHVDLETQLHRLVVRQDETDRRLSDVAALSGSSSLRRSASGNGSAVEETRTMQDLDAGFEEIHQNLTHLEARQSMWTMNQVMPIREEVTELRNNINMIRMHVNWLLNRSREEGRMRAANNTGSTTTVRRNSNGETMPTMPERRRSSGNEIDISRL